MSPSQHDFDDTSARRTRGEEALYDSRSRRSSSIVHLLLAVFVGGAITLLFVIFVTPGGIRSLINPTAPMVSLSVFPSPMPTPTPKVITGAAVIQQIQQLNRLESAVYSVESVVQVEKPGNVIGYGYQKLLVIVRGNVVAGIDLSKVRIQDIEVSEDGTTITFQMPEAEIFSRYLDEGATQLYDHQTGVFTTPDTALLIEAQKAGVQKILQGACEDGILTRATDNAQQALKQMFEGLGFERVDVVPAAIPVCPVANGATPTTTPVP